MHNGESSTGGAHTNYDTMSTEELMALPVQDIADEDCLLFMWIGSPILITALRVANAWGFRYVTKAFCWDKKTPNPGYYTLSQVEDVLLFKKGKIPTPRGCRKQRQFLSVKRGGHSVKPLQAKESIVKMFPTQEKIELFARHMGLFADTDDGWDYWGNQVI